MASTKHDRFLKQDYARMLDREMRVAREGLRWHLVERKRGNYDFSTVLPFLETSQQMGIQIIWDVMHFGWPDFLVIFDEEWVKAFEELSFEFARVLKREMSSASFVTPINEISFVAWGGGEEAHINPFARKRGSELKRQLVRGAIASTRAFQSELPGVHMVTCEPVIHIVGNPDKPGDVRQAEEYRTSMFEAWDMITGRLAPELGGQLTYLDIVGVNYYDRNQWWNYGETIWRGEREYRPFRDILKEVYTRYGHPMFVAETGTEDDKRRPWFEYICQETRAALADGVDMNGICLYPILNHPGWNDDRHCKNGLWDYAGPDSSREIYRPLADELRRQQQLIKEGNYHEQPAH